MSSVLQVKQQQQQQQHSLILISGALWLPSGVVCGCEGRAVPGAHEARLRALPAPVLRGFCVPAVPSSGGADMPAPALRQRGAARPSQAPWLGRRFNREIVSEAGFRAALPCVAFRGRGGQGGRARPRAARPRSHCEPALRPASALPRSQNAPLFFC